MSHMVAAMMPAAIVPGKVPSGIVVPAPSPTEPAVIAETEVRCIPTIPGIVPRIIPSVVVIPEEGIVEAIAMIAMETRRIVEVVVIIAAVIVAAVAVAPVAIHLVAVVVERIRPLLQRI